jgi:hypothetical protein
MSQSIGEKERKRKKGRERKEEKERKRKKGRERKEEKERKRKKGREREREGERETREFDIVNEKENVTDRYIERVGKRK